MKDPSSPPGGKAVATLATRTSGDGVGALVLGILSVAGSPLLIGGLAGLLGLLVGWRQRGRRRTPTAGWGLALSVGGLLLSAFFAIGYTAVYRWISQGVGGSSGHLASWEGVHAPDFAVTSLDGETLRLSELRGRRVVVDFWATWCGPCVRSLPHLVALSEANPEEELLVVGISDEDTETLVRFAAENGVGYPLASSRAPLPAPFGEVRALPTTFFIDRRGVIQTIRVGYLSHRRLRALALADDVSPDRVQTPPPRSLLRVERFRAEKASAGRSAGGSPAPPPV